MSAITAVTSAANTALASGNSAATASRVPQKVLGQNDFLKLLAAQFKTQDPMKPVEDTAFIAQMAQFSALEQSKNMATDMAGLRADQLLVTANSYLGHRVTVNAGDGKQATGDVSAVDLSNDVPRLVVGGVPYPLTAVLRVEPAIVTVPQPVTPGGA